MPEPIIVARVIGNSDWPGLSFVSLVRDMVSSVIAKKNEYYRIGGWVIPIGGIRGRKNAHVHVNGCDGV